MNDLKMDSRELLDDSHRQDRFFVGLRKASIPVLRSLSTAVTMMKSFRISLSFLSKTFTYDVMF